MKDPKTDNKDSKVTIESEGPKELNESEPEGSSLRVERPIEPEKTKAESSETEGEVGKPQAKVTEEPKEAEDSERSDMPEISDKSDESDSSEPSEPAENSEPTEPPQNSSPAELVDPSEATAPDVIKTSKKTDVKGTRWYVVHAYSGHESKVAATLRQRIESQKLQDKILEIMVPTQEKIEIKEGKKNTIREKIFPGYILINMILDDQSWLAVRSTPGITSFVGNLNKPTPLPQSEVESIQRFMSMEAPKFKTTFSIGEAVKIVDGPFTEFLGSVQELDEEKGKIKVLVSIFGRETPVELDFLQIDKL